MRPRYATRPSTTTAASGVTVAWTYFTSESFGSRKAWSEPSYPNAAMWVRMAAARSPGSGYTSRNTTPRSANVETIRRTSGAYRFEMGQSVLVNRNTIALAPAGAASASIDAPSNVWRRTSLVLPGPDATTEAPSAIAATKKFMRPKDSTPDFGNNLPPHV